MFCKLKCLLTGSCNFFTFSSWNNLPKWPNQDLSFNLGSLYTSLRKISATFFSSAAQESRCLLPVASPSSTSSGTTYAFTTTSASSGPTTTLTSSCRSTASTLVLLDLVDSFISTWHFSHLFPCSSLGWRGLFLWRRPPTSPPSQFLALYTIYYSKQSCHAIISYNFNSHYSWT